MKQDLLRIQTADALPEQVDVAIIGGGAAGIATAHALHKLGKTVAVFEKGIVAAEQSSRNWGWCRTLGRNENELELAKLSLDIWKNLGREIGQDVGFHQAGVAFVTDQPGELAVWKQWQAKAALSGISARILSADEANSLYPWKNTPWIGGIVNDADGYADPSKAIPLLAQYLEHNGVRILQQCAVNGLAFEGGKLAGIDTERGRVRASSVVLAGGAWSSLFCRKHGIALPIINVHSAASRTRELDASLQGPSTRATEFAFRQHPGGGIILAKSGSGTMHVVPDNLRYGLQFLELYRARKAKVRVSLGSLFFKTWWMEMQYLHFNKAPFAHHRTLDPAADMHLVRSAYQSASAVLPGISEKHMEAAWGGVIDNTPDGVPVVSAVESLPGFYLCTGFSGHGFSSSMGAGRSLAQLIATGSSSLPLDAFAYDRLINGSNNKPSILY